MQSNGGLIDARGGRRPRRPGRCCRARPAAPPGPRSSPARPARPDALCFDMGGTSCDVCVVDDGARPGAERGEIAGRPLALPMLAVHTVGAGGGSIAWRDAGGALRVGPRSAGADPGPACYGRGGTEPTVTDANLAARLPGARRAAGRRRRSSTARPRETAIGAARARARASSRWRAPRGSSASPTPRWSARCGSSPCSAGSIRAATRCWRSAAPGRCTPPRSPTSSGSTRSSARAPRACSRRSGWSSRRAGATSSAACC